MKSFRTFLEEKENPIVITIGRFNPPTIGHGKLIENVAAVARRYRSNFIIFPTTTQDSKKNPLSFKQKVSWMKEMFSKFSRNINTDERYSSIMIIAARLSELGHTKLVLVVGADRVREFETLLQKYNGVVTPKGSYNFVHGIDVVSAGSRDPDADDITGMSASKMRAAASQGDLKTFSQGIPKLSGSNILKLFNDVRNGLGLTPMRGRSGVRLPVTDLREEFYLGRIFNEGTRVKDLRKNEIFIISSKGTNYVHDEKGRPHWINDLTENVD